MDQEIEILMKKITDKIRSKGDQELKEHHLTMQQSRILIILDKNPDVMTQKEIENMLEVSHPTVTGIISRMERSGFLECSPDPEDRRNKIVKPTRKAKRITHEMEKKISENEAMMLCGLSAEQVSELHAFLIQINRNLDDQIRIGKS